MMCCSKDLGETGESIVQASPEHVESEKITWLYIELIAANKNMLTSIVTLLLTPLVLMVGVRSREDPETSLQPQTNAIGDYSAIWLHGCTCPHLFYAN